MQAHLHALVRSYLVESLNPVRDTLYEFVVLQRKLNGYYELPHVFTPYKIEDLQRLLSQENVLLTKLEHYYTALTKPHARINSLIRKAYRGFHVHTLHNRRVVKGVTTTMHILAQKTVAALHEERTLNQAFLHKGMDALSFIQKKKKHHAEILHNIQTVLQKQYPAWNNLGKRTREHSIIMHKNLEQCYALLLRELMKCSERTILGIKEYILDKPLIVHQQGQITIRRFLTLNQWFYQTGTILARIELARVFPTLHTIGEYYTAFAHFKMDHLLWLYAISTPYDLTSWFDDVQPFERHPLHNSMLALSLEELPLHVEQYIKQNYPIECVVALCSWILQSPFIPIEYREF